MQISFNPSVHEMRSIFLFNRLSTEISESVRRLATGQRILSGKDDPGGLISREIMRGDIRGLQAAQNATARANGMLSAADATMENISKMLVGDINNKDDGGLLGLIMDDRLSPEMKKEQIDKVLTMIDTAARGATYNGKRLLDGSMGEVVFQLGKDVEASMQHRMTMPDMTNLGLHELRSMDWSNEADRAKAYSIVNDAIQRTAVERGTIGAVQRFVLDASARNLETQLERTMETEGLISNVDMAVESSRLHRAEILAQSAMSAILHSRGFERFLWNLFL